MAAFSLREVSYQPDRVAFNQDQCVVCLDPFANNQMVTELACRHIFHSGCIPERVVQCPTCRDPIEGRIEHQVQVQNGHSFLQRMYSTDPAALNAQLEREAKRSIFDRNAGNQILQDHLVNFARGMVLGPQVISNVRQRADALFFRSQMGRMGPLNRLQRFFHIQTSGQSARMLELSENPPLANELSRRVAREYRMDERRAIVVAFSALIAVCFWIWSQRPAPNPAFG